NAGRPGKGRAAGQEPRHPGANPRTVENVARRGSIGFARGDREQAKLVAHHLAGFILLRYLKYFSRLKRRANTRPRTSFPSSAWERTSVKLCFNERGNGEAELPKPLVPKLRLGTRLRRLHFTRL